MARNLIGMLFSKIGAKMWQPAFDKGYAEDFTRLNVFEKIGYLFVRLGLKIMKIDEETFANITTEVVDNQ